MKSRLDVEVDVVVRQYHELGSCAKVAELFGCSMETIRRILKDNGIARTGWRHQETEKLYRFKVTDESKKEILKTFRETNDVAECCERLRCSNTTVYRILHENGINRRPSKWGWVNSPQAEEVADYYTQGHSVSDTAKRFGVTEYQVNNLAKARRISNGRSFQESAIISRKKATEEKLADTLKKKGFEYIGGYSGKRGTVSIRCTKCGAEYERTAAFLNRGNVICIECQKRETERRNEERRHIAEQNAEVRRIELEWHRLAHPPKDHYLEQHEAFLNREGICEICGKPYTVREYVESCGLKKAQDNGVCSEACRRRKKNQSVRDSRKRRGVRDNHRARAKKYGCEYDSSVTLRKLIKRDGLRCAICGEMCDPNDRSWNKNMGAMSPTIDHIIPMAKGGGHVWNNVQVAHAICNSYKCDNLSEV